MVTIARALGSIAVAAIGLGASAATPSAGAEAQPRQQAHLVLVSNRDGDNDVYSIRADGRAGAVTRNRVADEEVLLSPVGGWLVVTRSFALVLVRADGRWERKLGDSTYAPRFSPNGRWLAFARETDVFKETSRIELVEVGRDRSARRLGGGSPIGFSADGRRLAYVDDNGNVGVLDVASGRRTQVATESALEGGFPRHEDWSPNLRGFILERERDPSLANTGELVYFPARPAGKGRVLARGDFGSSRWLDDDRYGFVRRLPAGGNELIAARADGSGRRVIARELEFADWAPDGSNVAYRVGERTLGIASTSSSARRAIPLAAGSIYNLNWSPTGRRLAVTVSVGGRMDVLVVDARTRRVLRRLRGHPGYGSWSPDERSIAVNNNNVVLLDLDSGRRVEGWTGGDTGVVGWLRGPQPATLPAAAPAPPTEVVDATGFRSRTPVLELAADGAWVAALLAEGRLDREHVVAWRPHHRAVVRFASTSPAGGEYGRYQELSLNGTVVRWTSFGCGNSCYLSDVVADVRKPLTLAVNDERLVEQKPPRPPLSVETKRGVTSTGRAGLIELRHTDGRSRTIRPPGRLVDLELEESGLFYAYNTTGTFRGQVVFIPFDKLLP